MSRLIYADALKRKYEDRKRLFCRNRIEFSALSDKDKARVDELDNCIADILNAPTIVPKAPWIPFDEQQPEYGQQILVTIHWHESGEEEYFVQLDTYFDDATLNSNFKIGRDAFAWMPLPETYREEGD